MLPMQDPALALEEFDRVAKLPGIRGIYMATQINGRIDEKEFWPVVDRRRREERGFAIFLHPVNPVGADRMGRYHLRNFIGNPNPAPRSPRRRSFSQARSMPFPSSISCCRMPAACSRS